MAINILERLTDALSDQMVNQASQYLGESEEGTQSAFGMLLPVLLGGLVKQGSTAEGARALLRTLAGSEVDSGLLGNLGGLFAGGVRTESLVGLGTHLVKGLLGDKIGSVIGTIASVTGLKSSSTSNLLYMAAPLVFGFIKKLVGEGNLDAPGLMRLLGEQLGFLKGSVDKRLIGALGLGSLFDEPAKRATQTVRRVEPYIPPTLEPEPSPVRKLLPWLLAIAGAVAAIFALRSCKPNEEVALATAPVPAIATAPVTAVAPVPAPVPVTSALPAKIYFAIGSAAVDEAARRTLADVATVVKNQGQSVDLTGFTDRTGHVAKNVELAKRRAMAIKDALMAKGIPAGNINMKPPLTVTGTTTGSGSDAEARRVEISLAK